MERDEYERLAAVEDQGWWFHGLRLNLLAALRRTDPGKGRGALLDAGCGTGGALAAMGQDMPHLQRFGVDLDPLAASIARVKSGAHLVVGSVAGLPFARASFDTVLSTDVLCHRGVEPVAALRSMRACLKPGGVLLLNLPAYPWLLSGHDHAVDNVRRFGRKEVRRMLEGAGFAQLRVGYWNSLLFPLMVLQRLTHRGRKSDVTLLPAPIERLFGAAIAFESRLREFGLRFPFGGSILATAVRP